jgi:hypothetical protein
MLRRIQLHSALANRVQDPESILTVIREAVDREVELSLPISQAMIRLATMRSIRQQLHDQKHGLLRALLPLLNSYSA